MPTAVVADLAVPSIDALPASQPVALVDGAEFSRSTDAGDQQRHYAERRQTRLYEGVDVLNEWWFRSVALQLSHLLNAPVTASVYESAQHDTGLLPHTDAWTGLVLQLRGAKQWTFANPCAATIVVEPGDVLFVPTVARHHVSTPDYSAHVVFEALTEQA